MDLSESGIGLGDDEFFYVPRFSKSWSQVISLLRASSIKDAELLQRSSVLQQSPNDSGLLENSNVLHQSHNGVLTLPANGEGSSRSLSGASQSFPLPDFCAFCRSNGETKEFYSNHRLKDSNNQVLCPILQKYVCPICNATGSLAHTLKYCPKNPKPLPRTKPIRRNAIGKHVTSYN